MNRTAVYTYSQASKHLGYNNIGQTITIDDENAFCPMFVIHPVLQFTPAQSRASPPNIPT